MRISTLMYKHLKPAIAGLFMLFLINTGYSQVTQLVPWTKAYDVASNSAFTYGFAIPNGSGANRILVVGITATNTGTSSTYVVSGITYGGTSLTADTSNMGTSGRAHTALYHLLDDPLVMNNSPQVLFVSLSAVPTNMSVWYAVFDGVDQTATYTHGNGFTNSTGSGPAALSPAMAINANEQPVYISNIVNVNNTTLPTYTINANWTSGGTNTGTTGGTGAWKNEVANRTIPVVAGTTDAATTSTFLPTNSERWAMSAMCLTSTLPVLSVSALTGFGNVCTGTTGGPNSFTITGKYLTAADVTVGALAGYTYSTSAGGPYTTTLSIAQPGGSFSQQVYVELTPTLLQSYAGNIPVGGGGSVLSWNVAATGTGVTPLSGLGYTSTNNTYCTSGTITANTVTGITGGGTITYSVSPALPTGLTVSSTTGAISGTPSPGTEGGPTAYTITATNGSCSTTAIDTITIITGLSAFSYMAPTTVVYCNGSAITPMTVAGITGGGTITYSVSPTLPTGLSLNTSDGSISGTPTADAAATIYTVKADNGACSITATVNIGVITPLSALTYTTPVTYCLNVTIPTNNIPTYTGSGTITWGISAGLPTGLNFSTTTGIISGRPTVNKVATDYTVTATNGCNSTTKVVNIAVVNSFTSLNYTNNTVTYCNGVAIANNSPTLVGGGGTITYSVNPALPTGLSLNTGTGVISGTPTVNVLAANYTVTAKNDGCSVTRNVNIAVVTPLSGLTYTSPTVTYCTGAAITPNTVSTITGGGTITYSSNPVLPTGLSFNAAGTISGTPTVASGATVYTVTASNGTGGCSTTSNITITVAAGPTAVAGTAVPTCSNIASVNITAGSSATNTSGTTWTTSNGTGTFANATSLTTATYSPSAADIAAGSRTLTLTANGTGSCAAVAATSTKTITITTAPTATAGTAVATCSNTGAVNITAGSTATNQASITWTSSGTGTFTSPTSLTNATYTPSAADISAGSVTLTLTANGNGSCAAATSTKTLTITAAPTATAGTAVATCSNIGAVNITAGSSATNTSGTTWSTTNGTGTFTNATSLTTATYTPSAADITAGSRTLRLTANGNGSCAAATSNKTITITTAPTATAGTAVATCSNTGAVNITAGSTATNQASITWTSSGTGTFTSPTSLTNATYTPSAADISAGSVTLTLTANGNGSCAAATSTKTLTITAAPTATAGTAVATCSNIGAVNITAGSSATNTSGTTWSTTNGTGTFTNATSLTTATYTPSAADITAGSRTLRLTANGNGSCAAATSNKTITITTAPTATAGTAVATCSNTGAVNITAGSTASNQASITWTSSGTGTFANATSLTTATYTPSAADISAGSVTLTLTANGNGSCAAATSTKTLTITAAPTATAGTAVTTCSNSGAVNITAGSNATNQSSIAWTSSGTGTFTNATSLTTATYTPSAADIAAGSVTLTLTANGNGGCAAAQSTKTLTITPAPTVSTPSSSVCIGYTITLSPTTGGTWVSSDNTKATVTNAGLVTGVAAGSVTFTFTDGSTGCSNTTSSVTVNNSPSAPTGTAAQTFCAINNPTVANLTATGTAILWYAASSGGTALATSTPLVDGSHYFASQTTGGCESVSRFDVTVTVSDPVAPTGTAAQSFCAINNPTVASLSATGTGILWYAASSGGTALATSTALVNGTHYYASQTVAGCEGTARFDVTVTIDDPAAPTGTAAQSFCAINNPTVADLAATGTGILWYAAASGGTALATSTALVDGTHYYASQTVAGCESATRFDVTATVSNTAPTGSAAQSFCADASHTVADLVATGTAIQWYAASTGGSALPTTDVLVDGTHYYASQTVGGCESAARLDVTVAVNDPVVITADPGPPTQSVCASNTVTYMVTATGTGLTYQWLKNGSPISNGGNISGATTDILQLTNVTTADDGSYSVTVSGVAPCSPATSAAAVLTVNQTITFTVQPAATSTICEGQPFTISARATGTISTYNWFKVGTPLPFAAGYFDGIDSFSLTIAAVATTDAGSYFLTLDDGSSSGCTSVNSNNAVLAVNPVSVGGTTSGSATVCYGTNTGSITLAGKTGNVVRWESSTDNFVTTTTIANITTSLTYTNLTQTTKYRAVVQNGVCAAAYSDTATITVNPNLVAGTIASNQNICYNTVAAPLTSSATPTGGTGSYTYQWQSSPNNSTWTNIGGETGITYTPASALTATMYYRRNETSGSCGTVSSNVITVTVYGILTGGTVATTPQTICYNTAPAAFTSSVAVSGADGTYTYQWQSSPDGSTWTDIGGATADTYAPGALTATTYYQRNVTSTTCGTTATSNVITINVGANLVAGIVGSNQTICYNTAPAVLTGPAPTGGSTPYSYQWQSSTDNITFGNVVGGTGANTTTYTPAALTQTTYYRRNDTSSNGCGIVYTDTITITVNPNLVAGTVGSNQNICNNTIPAPLTDLGSPTGGTGSYTYQWQSSPNGVSGWTDIVGETVANYTPSAAITTTIYYHRNETSGTCGTVSSNVITVTVYGNLTGGTVAATPQTICYNTPPTAFTSTTGAGGGNGTFSYQWQSSPDNATWSDIGGATGATYGAGTLTATTYYRRNVTSAGCGPVSSNVITVNVRAQLLAGVVAANQTICYNTIPVPFTSTALPTGGTGTYTYQWQSSIDNITFGNAAGGSGATTAAYTPPALTMTTYYRRNETSGTCGTVFSDTITVSVNGNLTAGTIGTAQTICANTTPAALTELTPATGGTGVYTYQWQSSPNNNNPWTSIGGATSATYAPGSLATTIYYRRNVTSGTCGTVSSASVLITVNQAPATTGVTICQGGNGTISSSASCATAVPGGPVTNLAGTGAASGAGSVWTAAANITASDLVYATSTINAFSSSQTLTATNFGFNIPTNATITGIQVKMGRYASGSTVTDNTVQLIKNGSTTGITNNNGATWSTTAGASATIPAATNSLWGTTWTYADINAANFGVNLIATNGSFSSTRTVNVDYIQIIVSYTTPNPNLTWYTLASGGTSIGFGSPFNPVGADPALPNTNTPGTFTYYAECAAAPGCRTATNFVINPSPSISIVSGSLSICTAGNKTVQLQGDGTPAVANAWVSGTPAVATVSPSTGLTTTVTAAGAATATSVITYTNNNGCKITATVNVVQPTITGNASVCVGATTPLTGSQSGAAVNAWVSATPAVATVSPSTGLLTTLTGVTPGTSVITYTNNNGCTVTKTETVTDNGTISLFSAAGTDAQTICTSAAITSIVYQIAGTGSGASISPSLTGTGLSGSYSSGTKRYTISGTPTFTGAFPYTVTVSGSGCTNNSITGTITINPNASITLSSGPGTDNQTSCIGDNIPDITYTIGGSGTGASIVAGSLPPGVTGVYDPATKIFKIDGTPTATGTYSYAIQTTGPCVNVAYPGVLKIAAKPAGSIVVAETSGLHNNDSIICTGAAVKFTATAGFSFYNFKVNGVSVQALATNIYNSSTLADGDIVTVDVTNASGCLTTFGPVVMVVNPLPTGSVIATENSGTANDNIICAGSNVTFTADPGFTNYSFKVNGSVVQSGASNTYSSTTLTNGQSVTVDVTNSNGCLATIGTPQVITVNALPVGSLSAVETSGTTANDNKICVTDNILVTATNGFNPYNFKVDGISAQNNGTNTFSTSSLLAGIHSITVDVGNASGCSATFTLLPQVQVFALPTPTLAANNTTICAGTSVIFTSSTLASGNYNFKVNGISVQNGSSNTYTTTTLNNNDQVTVDVKNSVGNNCVGTSNTVLITVLASPSGTFTVAETSGTIHNDGIICTGDSVTFFAPPGNSNYDFKINGILVQSGAVDSFSTTSLTNGASVTVDVTNTTGCIRTFGPIVITVNALPTGTLSYAESSGTNSNDGIICLGGNVTYTASPGFSNYDFKVNGVSVQNSFSNTFSTTDLVGGDAVTVDVTNNNNCVGTLTAASITVLGLPTPTLTGPGVFCVGDVDTFYTDPGYSGSYVWSVTNGTIKPGTGTSLVDSIVVTWLTGPKSVSVNYADVNGCPAAIPATAMSNGALPVPTITGSSSVCQYSTVVYITETGKSDYAWTVTGGVITSYGPSNDSSQVSIYWNGAPGTRTITVNYTAGSGCDAASPTVKSVTVKPAPVIAAITGTTTVCVNSTTLLADVTAGGTWSSSDNAIATINASTGLVTGVSAGTVTITYTVTGANGCTYNVTTSVTVNPLPVIAPITGTTNVCINSTTALADVTTGDSFVWSSGNNAVATIDAVTGVVTGVTASAVTITYTVTTNGCSDHVTTSVTVKPLPTVAPITGTTRLCISGTTTLADATTGGTWSGSDNAIATIDASTGVVTGVSAGTITVTYSYTGANGCSNTVTTSVTVVPTPTLITTNPAPVCTPATVDLATAIAAGTTPGLTYTYWTDAGATISYPTPHTAVAGYYWIQGATPEGCLSAVSGPDTATVNPVPPPFLISPAGTTNICQGTIQPLIAATSLPVSGTLSYASGTINLPITDAIGVGFATIDKSTTLTNLSVATIPAGAIINSMSVTLNITHARDRDLIINLQAPNGNSLNLLYRRGGRNGANYTNTVISSASSTGINGAAPFTGTYRADARFNTGGPVSNVTNFASLFSTPNGTWTLGVSDSSFTRTGTILNWTITINYSIPAGALSPLPTWSPATDLYTDPAATVPYVAGTGATFVYAKPSSSGTKVYTATASNVYGCTTTKSDTLVVNATPVVTIAASYCAVPGKIQLTATAAPVASSYVWSTGETTQSIAVTDVGDYSVTAFTASGCAATANFTLSSDLVANGDFEALNAGFTSAYNYVADVAGNAELTPAGTFSVSTSGQNVRNNFWGPDHSTGSGNYMIINGLGSVPLVWQETVNVLPNTSYNFSAWAKSMNNISPFAQLQLKVNGANVGSPVTLTAGVNNNTNAVWTRLAGSWTSGPSTTTAVISVTDVQGSPVTQYFGLDDISFGSLSTFVSLSSASGTDGQTVCVNTPITDISYAYGGVSNPTVTGLPAGLSFSYNGVNAIISGTPTVAGTFSYTVSITGCNPIPVTATGTITVVKATIALSSGSTTQSTCINTPISPIVYNVGGTATGADTTGLPPGLVLSYSSGVFTISGTPTAGGTYHYKVITTGGACAYDSAIGTITVKVPPTSLLNGLDAICNSQVSTIFINVTGTGAISGTLLPGNIPFSGIAPTILLDVSPSVSTTYTIGTLTDNTGCTAVQGVDIIGADTVNVNPTPDAAISSNVGICLNGASPAIVFTGLNGTDPYTFGYKDYSGVTHFITGSTPVSIAGPPTTAAGLFIYTLVSVSDAGAAGCSQNFTGRADTITVYTPPAIANQTAANSCGDNATSLTPTFTGTVPVGTVYTWSAPVMTGGITGGSTGTNQAFNTGTFVNNTGAVQTATFTITPNNGTCVGSSFTFVVNVDPVTANTAYWLGRTSTDWSVATNWSCGKIPDSLTNVIIPSGSPNHAVSIPAGYTAKANNITIDINPPGPPPIPPVTSSLSIANTGLLKIYGSFVNGSQGFVNMLGTVEFAGLGANQVIPGYNYMGLSVSGTGTKTPDGPTLVGGLLNLLGGVIVPSPTNTLTLDYAATNSPGSATSYVRGSLTRLTNSTGVYEFPIGGTSGVRMAAVLPTTTDPSSFTATYTYLVGANANPSLITDPQLFNILNNEYWVVTKNSGLADAYTAFSYQNPNGLAASAPTTDWTVGLNPCTFCNVAVVEADPSAWNYSGGSSYPGGWSSSPLVQTTNWQSNSMVYSRTTLSANPGGRFSFGVGLIIILDVTLTDFHGTLIGDNGLLEWKFTQGSEFKSTELQYSTDGRNWTKLVDKPAMAGISSYDYLHINLPPGANYYRLKITDLSGKETYSKTVLLVAGKQVTVIKGVRPTMVQTQAFLDIYSVKSQSVRGIILDAAGRTITELKGKLSVGDNSLPVNTMMLVQGMYTLQVKTDDGVMANLRFIKQ